MSRSRRQPPLFEVMSDPQRQQLSPVPLTGTPAIRRPDGTIAPTLPRLTSPNIPPAPVSVPVRSSGSLAAPSSPTTPPLSTPATTLKITPATTSATTHTTIPPNSPASAEGSLERDFEGMFGGSVPRLAFAVVAVIVVGSLLWVTAYRLGQSDERKNLFAYGPDQTSSTDSNTRPATDPLAHPTPLPAKLPPAPTSGTPTSRLLNPTQLPQTPTTPPKISPPVVTPVPTPPKPEKIEPVTLATDPRKPGFNYLEIVRLTARDADEAVAYLKSHGVNAAAVPLRKVDPGTARANNLPHLVIASDGVPSDRFRASAPERSALVEKIRSLGQRFQKEERGASDFAEPGWALFKGE